MVPIPHRNFNLKSFFCANKGKYVTVYVSFPNNYESNTKLFKGVIDFACSSFLVLLDPQTGTRYVIIYENIDYITFDEPINLGQDCC